MNKTVQIMLFTLIVLLAAIPGHSQERGRLRITYIGFADTLELDGNRLSHSFAQQSSTPRSAVRQLVPIQEQQFVNWLGRCRVFSLTGPDVLVSEPYHPGAEEHHALRVEYGGKKIDLSWRGVSSWNDPAQKEALDRAVDELTKLSIRLLREADQL